MEFNKTQLGRVLEDVKRAMLAHTPIVYIPTDQLEIIQELLLLLKARSSVQVYKELPILINKYFIIN